MAPLIASGASCASCKHRVKYGMTKDPICELDSDWEGYVTVKLTDLCPRWAQR